MQLLVKQQWVAGGLWGHAYRHGRATVLPQRPGLVDLHARFGHVGADAKVPNPQVLDLRVPERVLHNVVEQAALLRTATATVSFTIYSKEQGARGTTIGFKQTMA